MELTRTLRNMTDQHVIGLGRAVYRNWYGPINLNRTNFVFGGRLIIEEAKRRGILGRIDRG